MFNEDIFCTYIVVKGKKLRVSINNSPHVLKWSLYLNQIDLLQMYLFERETYSEGTLVVWGAGLSVSVNFLEWIDEVLQFLPRHLLSSWYLKVYFLIFYHWLFQTLIWAGLLTSAKSAVLICTLLINELLTCKARASSLSEYSGLLMLPRGQRSLLRNDNSVPIEVSIDSREIRLSRLLRFSN